MYLRRFLLLTALGLSLGTARTAQAGLCVEDVCVRFQPATFAATLGYPFTIDVVADINSPVLGWGLDVTIATPGVISTSADPEIGPAWIAVNAPDGDKLAGIAFPNGVSGSGILLATLHFHPDADGETDLLLGITAGDQTEGFALDPSGFASVHFENGRVTVPEPTSLALCLIGVALTRRGSRVIA